MSLRTSAPGSALGRLRVGVATAVELIRALWNGRFWWLVPLLFVLLPLALVFVFLQAFPVVAPFVYTVF